MSNPPPVSHRANININLVGDDDRINMSGDIFHGIVGRALNHGIQEVNSNIEVAYRSHLPDDAGVGGDLEVSITIDHDMRGLDDRNGQAARNADAEAVRRNTQAHWSVRPVDADIHQPREIQAPQPNEPGRPTLFSAAAKLLGFLPAVSVGALSEDKRSCPICAEHFSAADKPILIRCNHAVGRACIEQWILSGHNSCPLCRATIFEPAA